MAFGIEIRNPYFLYRAEFRLRKNNIAHSRAAITDVLALAQLLLLRLQLVTDEYSCTLWCSTERKEIKSLNFDPRLTSESSTITFIDKRGTRKIRRLSIRGPCTSAHSGQQTVSTPRRHTSSALEAALTAHLKSCPPSPNICNRQDFKAAGSDVVVYAIDMIRGR